MLQLAGTQLDDRSGGLLKNELRRLDSLLLDLARQTSVPAGGALAVDRQAFAERVTQAIESHPNIQVVREEATGIPSGPAIIASGPLTSPRLSEAIQELTGRQHLYFYDAIAPSSPMSRSIWILLSRILATNEANRREAITSTAP